MRKLIITAASIAALVVPTAAMAAPDTSEWVWNDNAASQGPKMGEYSSRILHNGWWISDQKGDRSDNVQADLALDGLGLAKN